MCARMFTCGRAHICVRYPSVCPAMKAVSVGANPTISTGRLNDRDIFALSETEAGGQGMGTGGQKLMRIYKPLSEFRKFWIKTT